jgi:hypothetical protein
MSNLPPPPPGQPLQWMQKPQPIPGVPPGLEYFTQIEGVQVEQQKSFLEAFAGWETNNKYVVRNAAGQQCFYAVEDTDTCMRMCCGKNRGFIIKVLDNSMTEVMRFTRQFKCFTGCCWCAGCCDHCAFEVKVEAPVGQVIGYVKQGGSFWKANYEILDENREKLLEIDGPCCICDGACCPCDNEFRLMTLNKDQQIGSIKKIYAGFLTELATQADRFTLDFPMDLSAKCKASLLGALFLMVGI